MEGITMRIQRDKLLNKVNGKEIYLGLFNDIKDAIEARHNAEQKYFII